MKKVLPVSIVPRESLADWDLLAVAAFAGEAPEVAGLSEALRAAVGQVAARTGWEGREEQRAETAVEGGPVVALHGLGPRAELTWRKLAAWLIRVADEAQVNGAARLAFLLPAHPETSGGTAAERIARVLALGDYRFERYLTKPPARPRLARVAILPPAGEEATYAAAAERAAPLAAAVALAKDLGNTPANEATPPWLEERAAELARERGMGFAALGEEALREQRMGGLLAVGAGGSHPPRLLRLEVGDRGPAVALVGKGVTFDSGGISIKPAADMDEMKYDKCGATTALALGWLVAGLDLPLRLRVYLPVAENLLDSRAFRPGDIVRFRNGKTAEITNTDAEGRVILADAMCLAADEGAEILLEYSTLTGAVLGALGRHQAGLFTPDDELAAALLAAAGRTGEKLWRLPLGPEYLEEMKGVHADLRNAATRLGAASTAAAFLSQFVGGVKRWAHLDIAGVAWIPRDLNGHPGATGYGIALTLDYLRGLVGESG